MITNVIYTDDEMLPLSGIQHYMYCPRQWALIHLEQQWSDNLLTAEGQLLHSNVDNPFLRQTNGSDIITLRGLRIASYRLGLNGIADAVELHPYADAPSDKAALITSRQFTAIPVEYKRGHRKLNDCDRLQVAAQAMMLEEMLNVNIDRGAIFYWEERHREYVDIEIGIRNKVTSISKEMHDIMNSRVTPKAKKHRGCKSCSLVELCMPILSTKSAVKYLMTHLHEETS